MQCIANACKFTYITAHQMWGTWCEPALSKKTTAVIDSIYAPLLEDTLIPKEKKAGMNLEGELHTQVSINLYR